MIKLTNINKYFNKNKSNENHVCKDTSLEFATTGLVVILGSSGSGKTTLLNIMSGMDKSNSGTIQFNDQIFTKYKSRIWDEIRNKNIGYIYQNYQLLNDLTVYDNIELVLKMNGIDDKDEISKRIAYLLDMVGMKNYEDRLASQLSGGQQQRVAFARALSKNPDVIIADEPTGNLDSKTTIELMNILKSISKKKLVIMVSHEQALADYYADRIIELYNGKIVKDYVNENIGNLAVIQEQIIYLQDYDKKEFKSENIDLVTYQDKEANKDDKIGVELIQRNETLYVKVDDKNFRRVKYIDKDSEIELLDESSMKNTLKKTEFNFENIINENVSQKKYSAITFRDSLKYALRKVNKLSYGGKMLYVVLGLVGVIVAISIGLIGEVYNIDEGSFVEKNRNYIKVNVTQSPYLSVMDFENIEGVEQVMLVEEKMEFDIHTEQYYQITQSVKMFAHPVDIKFFEPEKLLVGSIPDGYGVIIDVSLADDLISKYSNRGIESYEDVLNMSFKLQTSGQDYFYADETALLFPITGIADDKSPTVWLDEALIYSFAVPTLVDYQLLGDNFNVVTGEMPDVKQEILININSNLIRKYDIPSQVGISTGTYNVNGTFSYVKDGRDYDFSNIMISKLEFLKFVYFQSYHSYKVNHSFLIYTKDVEGTLDRLYDLDYNVESEYNDDYEVYRDFKLEENASFYIFSLVGIVISSISIYFIMRSSLISRVYEVSVYRSLGASKNEIRKMFFVEILLTTTISSIVGYILMVLLLLQAESNVSEYVSIVDYPFTSFLLGIAGLYIINIVFGLIPINVLLYKTPSQIMTKYDL